MAPGQQRPDNKLNVERQQQSQLVLSQLVGSTLTAPGVAGDRRRTRERRRLSLWSVFYGGVRPRRRHLRRVEDGTVPVVDWHDTHLFVSAITVLLLSCADAFLTINLLLLGAREANPLMAHLIAADVTLFTSVKMALTGSGVLVLVLMSKYRLFGRLPVVTGLYVALVGYVVLVVYELLMLAQAG